MYSTDQSDHLANQAQASKGKCDENITDYYFVLNHNAIARQQHVSRPRIRMGAKPANFN